MRLTLRYGAFVVAISVTAALAVLLLRSSPQTDSSYTFAPADGPAESNEYPEDALASPLRNALSDTHITLRGRVISTHTGDPLAGVPLILRPQMSSGSIKQVTSQDSGVFAFSGMSAGAYEIVAGSNEKCRYTASPSVELVLTANTGDLEISVEQKWFVRGRVIEAGSRLPVPDLTLVAGAMVPGQWVALGTTDESGRFAGSTPFGAGVLSIGNVVGVEGLVGVGRAGHSLAEVKIGSQDVSDLVIVFDWQGTIAGRVVDEFGRPIRGAVVRAVVPECLEIGYLMARSNVVERSHTVDVSSISGHFVLRRLPNDRRLQLVGSARGFNSGVSRVLEPPFVEGAPEQLIELLTGGTIVGYVLDTAGTRVAGVLVFAEADGLTTDAFRTNERGEFVLDGLRGGVNTVYARSSDDAGMGSRLVARERVQVEPGQCSRVVLRTFANMVRIAGFVVDSSGKPVEIGPEMRVSCASLDKLPGSLGSVSHTVVRDGGRFELDGLAPGPYRLYLFGGGKGVGVSNVSMEVEAPADDVRLVWCSPESAGVLCLRVVDDSGMPVRERGRLAVLWEGGGIDWSAFEGQREFEVRASNYWAFVDVPGYSPVCWQCDLRERRGGRTVELIQLGKGRTVSGVVHDPSGDGVAGVAVTVTIRGQPFLSRVVHTDGEGRFVIDHGPTEDGRVSVTDVIGREVAGADIGDGRDEEIVITLANRR